MVFTSNLHICLELYFTRELLRTWLSWPVNYRYKLDKITLMLKCLHICVQTLYKEQKLRSNEIPYLFIFCLFVFCLFGCVPACLSVYVLIYLCIFCLVGCLPVRPSVRPSVIYLFIYLFIYCILKWILKWNSGSI